MSKRLGQRWAKVWHLATALIGSCALVLQLILVITGASVLLVEDPPNLPTRLFRLISYFTIQSNILVLLTAIVLWRDPDRDGPRWRVVRVDAILGITATGLVHWFLLRPLLNLTGWSSLADRLLHLVIPVMAVIGWLIFGPRPRMSFAVVAKSLIWPIAWLAYTLVLGRITGWYPYPFLDVAKQGYARAGAACLGVAGLLASIALLMLLCDRKLPNASEPVTEPRE